MNFNNQVGIFTLIGASGWCLGQRRGNGPAGCSGVPGRGQPSPTRHGSVDRQTWRMHQQWTL